MAIKQFQSRICNKRDTETNWIRSNPILLNGEIVIVDTDNGKIRMKIGDGEQKYNALPFNDDIKVVVNGNIMLYADGYPLYGTSFVDVDSDGYVYLRENGDGDYLISVSFSGVVVAEYIGNTI